EDNQGALRTAVLEPPVLRAVDLNELTHAFPAITRLMHGLEPLAPILPDAIGDHPAPHRLDAQMQAVPLGELLGGQRRPEVGVVRLDQRQSFAAQDWRVGAVARLAALLRDESCRPLFT